MDGQASTLKPSSIAAASATATTRSLKEWVGLARSSFTHRLRRPSSRPSCSAWTRRVQPGLGVGRGRHVRRGQGAGWRNARCWPGPPRWRPGPASGSRSGPPAARSTQRRRGWSPAGRSGRIPGSSARWRSRTGRAWAKRGYLGVMCSRGEAFLLICPSGRMAEGRTWHLSREWPRGHTSRDGCRGFTGPYPSTPLDERYEVVARHSNRSRTGAPDGSIRLASRSWTRAVGCSSPPTGGRSPSP